MKKAEHWLPSEDRNPIIVAMAKRTKHDKYTD